MDIDSSEYGIGAVQLQVWHKLCERIRWPRAMMAAFLEQPPTANDDIVWWKNTRRNEERYLLALPDFSYLFVVADRGEFVLPWTQFHVAYEHRRKKYQREFDVYWTAQKS